MLDFTKTFLNAIKHYIDSKKLSDFENDLPIVEVPELEKPDWNQNDPEAPDYIKNRTHWTGDEEIVTVIPETQLHIDSSYVTINKDTEQLIVGKTYIVTLNGVEYECVARQYGSISLIGNGTIYGDGNPSNNEPFSCDSYENGTIYLNAAAGDYTFSLSEKVIVVHKLEDKYIPYADMTWDKIGTKFGELVLVEEQTINLEAGITSDLVYNKNYIESVRKFIHDGQQCVVTFDGVDYQGELYVDDEYGTYCRFTHDTTGVEVSIYEFRNITGPVSDILNGEHTIKATAFCVRPEVIDDKYLPLTLARAKDYLNKENPMGYGSLAMNIPEDALLGDYSVSLGDYSVASGHGSTAIGRNVTAVSKAQHVIGEYNILSSTTKHTQIVTDIASKSFSQTVTLYVSNEYTYSDDTGNYELINYYSGKASILPDLLSKVSNKDVYISLLGPTTSSMYHIVKGNGNHGYISNKKVYIYNLKYYYIHDVNNVRDKYAHIVGNGTSDSQRSNAHTLDWNGNAWFAGKVFVGGTGQDDPNAIELGSSSGVSSWNDLTDKPFYENLDILLTCEFTAWDSEENSSDYKCQSDKVEALAELLRNNEYIFIEINGVVEKLNRVIYETSDGDVIEFTKDSDGRSIFGFTSGEYQNLSYSNDYETMPVSFTANFYTELEVKQLDEKFIPDTIARKSDLEALNAKFGDIESICDEVIALQNSYINGVKVTQEGDTLIIQNGGDADA